MKEPRRFHLGIKEVQRLGLADWFVGFEQIESCTVERLQFVERIVAVVENQNPQVLVGRGQKAVDRALKQIEATAGSDGDRYV